MAVSNSFYIARPSELRKEIYIQKRVVRMANVLMHEDVRAEGWLV